MMRYQWPYALATLLFAAGIWVLLPRAGKPDRKAGVALLACGLSLLTLLVHFGLTLTSDRAAHEQFGATFPVPRLETWFGDLVFLMLAGVTVVSAIGAVTLRSPVYCAIWFALTLTGTAGLFLYQGAQFLGVATIVVYAGAILVTFLFVLMLANPEGYTYYDRTSWEAPLSACAGAVMVGLLTIVTASVFRPEVKAFSNQEVRGIVEGSAADHALSALKQQGGQILADDHMVHLGRVLFDKHLIAIELAGTLLMVALVGAVAIVAHTRGKSLAPGGSSHG